MAEPGEWRLQWSRAASWAGAVQLLFLAFGAVQAYLTLRSGQDSLGAAGAARAAASRHALHQGLWWCAAQFAVGATLVALGFLGQRAARERRPELTGLRVGGTAVLVFVVAQVMATALATAVVRLS